VLSRYVDGIMIRTFDHAEVEELARFATIPVINGLTDLTHPCQVVADIFTIKEHLGGWEGKRIAWVGDGNNMANAWLEAAQVLGFELRLACPRGSSRNHAKFEAAKQSGCVMVTEVPRRGRRGRARREYRRVGLDGSGSAKPKLGATRSRLHRSTQT